MAAKHSFVFIDESGVLQGSSQRFFALGLMKLTDTSLLNEQLHRIYQRAQDRLQNLTRGFEFKFSDVEDATLPYHLDLVDAYFSRAGTHFCALVIDKARSNFTWKSEFPTVWDAYIGYSQLLLASNVARDEQVCVLADYLDKPKGSARYYEHEVCRPAFGMSPTSVFNVCMIESHAALLVQAVDVLLGGVRYAFFIERQAQGPGHRSKIAVMQRIAFHLGWPSLCAERCKSSRSRFFGVRELHVPEKAGGEPSI